MNYWPLYILLSFLGFSFVFLVGQEILDRAGWLTRWSEALNSLVDRMAKRISPGGSMKHNNTPGVPEVPRG